MHVFITFFNISICFADNKVQQFDTLWCHITNLVNKNIFVWVFTQPAITCSKLMIETLEQGVKYVQS